ncbi:putative secondary metabolism biosynthetic enzyme [Diaporthe eres]|uniref:Secondary metabolism biosynthetic enzyme n=1 Tax=Diaporthe eres TaxID=83184 RepID=A0ABR1P1S0_DIAER
MTVSNSIVLITGANSGIGYETVIALAKASPNYHILLGTRSLEKGQKALKDAFAADSSLEGRIELIQINVIDQRSIDAAKRQVERKFGKLDVLVNNAGIIVHRPDVDTLSSLHEHLGTNTVGTAICTEVFEPLLRKSSSPRLIHVSSDQGSISMRLDKTGKWYKIQGDGYRVSKAALNMLTACHKVNYEEWGCKVCAFNPGLCVTNLTGKAGREVRIQHGARDAKDAAYALVDIITGKRDADIDKFGKDSGILDLDGGILPW